jgi:hypothetical protein
MVVQDTDWLPPQLGEPAFSAQYSSSVQHCEHAMQDGKSACARDTESDSHTIKRHDDYIGAPSGTTSQYG